MEEVKSLRGIGEKKVEYHEFHIFHTPKDP